MPPLSFTPPLTPLLLLLVAGVVLAALLPSLAVGAYWDGPVYTAAFRSVDSTSPNSFFLDGKLIKSQSYFLDETNQTDFYAAYDNLILGNWRLIDINVRVDLTTNTPLFSGVFIQGSGSYAIMQPTNVFQDFLNRVVYESTLGRYLVDFETYTYLGMIFYVGCFSQTSEPTRSQVFLEGDWDYFTSNAQHLADAFHHIRLTDVQTWFPSGLEPSASRQWGGTLRELSDSSFAFWADMSYPHLKRRVADYALDEKMYLIDLIRYDDNQYAAIWNNGIASKYRLKGKKTEKYAYWPATNSSYFNDFLATQMASQGLYLISLQIRNGPCSTWDCGGFAAPIVGPQSRCTNIKNNRKKCKLHADCAFAGKKCVRVY